LREFAGVRRAFVVDEATPTGILSNAKVALGTLEECATIEARFRRGSVIVRGTTHHGNQLQKLKQAKIAG
jgi:hypothetical protein